MVPATRGTKRQNAGFSGKPRFLRQNTFAISVAGRGFEAHISTEFDVTLPDSACVYCGNCIAVCPTGALAVKRPLMEIDFDQEKCSICELCVPACPTRAMEIHSINQIFFE